MSKYIVLSSFKGGVLKTTVAVNLASVLALKGKRVLIFSADSQDDVAIAFNLKLNNQEDKTLYDFLLDNAEFDDCVVNYSENIDILRPDERLEDYEFDVLTNVYTKNNYLDILNDKLSTVEQKYDYIIVDTSPSFSIFTLQAYNLKSKSGETTDVIIPLEPEVFALKNLIRQIKKINKFNNQYNSKLVIKSVIITKMMNNNTHKFITSQIRQFCNTANINVLDTVIKHTIKFTEYILTDNKPLSLEEDANLRAEFKVFKNIYKQIVKELNYEN